MQALELKILDSLRAIRVEGGPESFVLVGAEQRFLRIAPIDDGQVNVEISLGSDFGGEASALPSLQGWSLFATRDPATVRGVAPFDSDAALKDLAAKAIAVLTDLVGTAKPEIIVHLQDSDDWDG